MKEELLREDPDITRYLEELIDRARSELLLRRKIIVPNPSYRAIEEIMEEINKKISNV